MVLNVGIVGGQKWKMIRKKDLYITIVFWYQLFTVNPFKFVEY